jgi:hypothetical protein
VVSDPADTCWFHGFEPLPPHCFRVCGECGHAYATAEDLLAVEHAEVARINASASGNAALGLEPWEPLLPHKRAEDIPFCPLCTHDW